jgi:putative transposase
MARVGHGPGVQFAPNFRLASHLSTRRYPVVLEPVGDAVEQAATSTSKSAVSRRFVAATAERLAELCSRRLDDRRRPIVMLDGVHLGDHLLVVALGVTADGTKVPLGVVEGSTENAAVATRLVTASSTGAWTPAAVCCSSSTVARRSPR